MVGGEQAARERVRTVRRGACVGAWEGRAMAGSGSKRRKTEESVWSERADQLAAEGGEREEDGAQEPEFDDGLSKEERR